MLSVPRVQNGDTINALIFPLHGANLRLKDCGCSSLCCQAITLTGHCRYCCWCWRLPSDCIHGTGSHRHGDGPREEDPQRGGSSELPVHLQRVQWWWGINWDFIWWKEVVLIGAKSVSNPIRFPSPAVSQWVFVLSSKQIFLPCFSHFISDSWDAW